jgi:hypothetical protein
MIFEEVNYEDWVSVRLIWGESSHLKVMEFKGAGIKPGFSVNVVGNSEPPILPTYIASISDHNPKT